jgi:CYTH domain-containing protein/predicted ATPase
LNQTRTGTEIEYRYIILQMDEKILQKSGRQAIWQGYFETLNPWLSSRLRIIDERKACLAIKKGVGVSRPESQKVIDLATAKFLSRSCPYYLEKFRYIPHQVKTNGVWMLDALRPPLAPVMLAEFEQKGHEEEIIVPQLPKWIYQAVEVTDSLSNLHLARLATELRAMKTGISSDSLYDHILSKTKKIPRAVLTGGPCSGKSEILKIVRKIAGKSVHCVPEVASILISQVQINPGGNPLKVIRFNEELYNTQKIFEATSAEQVLWDNKKLMLIDRGTVDLAVYLPGGMPQMENVCHTQRDYEYKRYDLVICMDVAPEPIYAKYRQNNPARKESYQEAVARGKKTWEVWKDHPSFYFIGNEGGWEEKKRRVLQILEPYIR